MELGPHGGGKPSGDPHGDSLTIFHGHKPCPGCPPPKAEDCTGEASAFPGVSWFGGGLCFRVELFWAVILELRLAL